MEYIPSEPAAIPIKRNIISKGTCTFFVTLIESKLINNKIPHTKIL